MDVHIRQLASAQHDVVAMWQLLAAGCVRSGVQKRARRHGWRSLHPGVYLLTQSPPTRLQLWMAAALTAPCSVLSHASAGACWGFRPWEGPFETITRPGSGGPRQMARLLVSRSTTLDGNTTTRDGIPITTGARTLLDLVPRIPERAARRCFREALRLKCTTRNDLRATLARHQGQAGTALLTALCDRYGRVAYGRTRSDAEGRALELIVDAGLLQPTVNVRIADEEADLVWAEQRTIIEIDGAQFHRFREEDASKEHRWRRAGYEVHRIRSDDVYERPGRLLELVPRPGYAPPRPR